MKKRKYITAAELEDIKAKDIMEHSRLATLIVYKNLKLVPPMTDFELGVWKSRQIFNKESITEDMVEEYEARCYVSKSKANTMEFSTAEEERDYYMNKILEGKIVEFEEKPSPSKLLKTIFNEIIKDKDREKTKKYLHWKELEAMERTEKKHYETRIESGTSFVVQPFLTHVQLNKDLEEITKHYKDPEKNPMSDERMKFLEARFYNFDFYKKQKFPANIDCFLNERFITKEKGE